MIYLHAVLPTRAEPLVHLAKILPQFLPRRRTRFARRRQRLQRRAIAFLPRAAEVRAAARVAYRVCGGGARTGKAGPATGALRPRRRSPKPRAGMRRGVSGYVRSRYAAILVESEMMAPGRARVSAGQQSPCDSSTGRDRYRTADTPVERSRIAGSV